ncbi:MAG: hypothetical protein U5K84_06295 [Alkalibacterium sp.]|nr:hypothetical protein [Alkalibacterium sp.]
MLEMRIPGFFLTSRIRVRKKILGDIWSSDGLTASQFIDAIDISVVAKSKRACHSISFQTSDETNGELLPYSWENWQKPGS